ncbi:hypothetical protein EQ718_06090 [Paracoccus versutus]|uniref:Uncharacterized protein n=1 Tax=Paracoccus versutus TaxID=34007 RepID=A0AAQ0KJ10_PARVE|nr:hypothetical protein [Paracoccus versutus]REG28128.1 hypothetical protein ATH84_106713 [Paracoccus versutus]WEJ78487.1 hypothetical protein EQ718_06090 [Paracoccus versutus]
MTLSRQAAFAIIGELSRQVLPRLHHAQRLPLRISCIGTARYDGLGDADGFDRSVVIGECPSEDAMIFTSQYFARGEALLQKFGLRRDFPCLFGFRPRGRSRRCRGH